MSQALAAIEGRSAELLITFFVAIAASVLLGAVMRRVSAAIGAVVPPRPDRWHNSPTPTMGGVAIALATMGAPGAHRAAGGQRWTWPVPGCRSLLAVAGDVRRRA